MIILQGLCNRFCRGKEKMWGSGIRHKEIIRNFAKNLAMTGGASAIQTSLMAFGLHRQCTQNKLKTNYATDFNCNGHPDGKRNDNECSKKDSD